MHYLIYRTTCVINGRYYIGQHQTKTINDSYLGSGMILKEAITKYGKENFVKEILKECSSKDEMNQAEIFIISKHINDPLCYNLAPGGRGGFLGEGAIKKSKMTWTIERRNAYSERMKSNEKLKLTRVQNGKRERTADERERISLTLTGKIQSKESIEKRRLKHIGRKNTSETRLKMSNAKKGKMFKIQHKEMLSKAAKNRPKVECPQCKMMCDKSTSQRWHFSNCRFSVKI